MSTALLRRSAPAVLRIYEDQSIQRVTVGSVIMRNSPEGPEVLVLRRRDDEEYGAIDELPSGAVEPGETLGQATRREAFEETTVLLDVIGEFAFEFRYPSVKGFTIQLNFVATVPFDVPVSVNDAEHTAWRWLPVAELRTSALTVLVRNGLERYFAQSAI